MVVGCPDAALPVVGQEVVEPASLRVHEEDPYSEKLLLRMEPVGKKLHDKIDALDASEEGVLPFVVELESRDPVPRLSKLWDLGIGHTRPFYGQRAHYFSWPACVLVHEMDQAQKPKNGRIEAGMHGQLREPVRQSRHQLQLLAFATLLV